MAELIAVLRKALWFNEEDSLTIDSTVFQLHNKVTIIVFVASSILVFTKQFFGSPIRCDAGYVSLFILQPNELKQHVSHKYFYTLSIHLH